MPRERMIELISESICVSKADAKAALEAQNWNVLEAAQLLQRQERARKVEAMRGGTKIGFRSVPFASWRSTGFSPNKKIT